MTFKNNEWEYQIETVIIGGRETDFGEFLRVFHNKIEKISCKCE